MKKRMAFGALLLTLGTAAAAGSFLYGNDRRDEIVQITLPSDLQPVSQEVTPEMIARWKSTAASLDFVVDQKAPI
jgi:hypothetical protein